jgi:hypothetical protein
MPTSEANITGRAAAPTGDDGFAALSGAGGRHGAGDNREDQSHQGQ